MFLTTEKYIRIFGRDTWYVEMVLDFNKIAKKYMNK